MNEYKSTNETIYYNSQDADSEIKAGTYTLVSGYDCRYAVNNDTGEAVNLDFGGVLTATPNKKGKCYYQIFPYKDGKRQPKLIHRFILEAGLLPNNRRCDSVHHINGQTDDNRPSNLLPVFSGREHKLLDKIRKDPSKEREYIKMIKKIRELNKEELFKIPHPDYKSDEHYNYYMFLTKDGYTAYSQGKDIPLNCIRRESAEKVEVNTD